MRANRTAVHDALTRSVSTLRTREQIQQLKEGLAAAALRLQLVSQVLENDSKTMSQLRQVHMHATNAYFALLVARRRISLLWETGYDSSGKGVLVCKKEGTRRARVGAGVAA
jgi:hypothetical protein